MSWPLDTVEEWVKTALLRLGYSENQANIGSQSVTTLQQRNAPGVAAIAQHMDFLSAYKLTPNDDEQDDASCPILVAESIKGMAKENIPHTFAAVRQPLLLVPALVDAGGSGHVNWNDTQLPIHRGLMDIDPDRKTLRTLLVEKADVRWSPLANSQTYDESRYLTEIPSRELVYVKTVQHYAGTLPPREPLDGADTSDNSSSSP